MSSVRSILKFLKFGSKKTKKAVFQANLKSLILTTRALGSINFFLNGKIVVKDASGKASRIILPDGKNITAMTAAAGIASE